MHDSWPDARLGIIIRIFSEKHMNTPYAVCILGDSHRFARYSIDMGAYSVWQQSGRFCSRCATNDFFLWALNVSLRSFTHGIADISRNVLFYITLDTNPLGNWDTFFSCSRKRGHEVSKEEIPAALSAHLGVPHFVWATHVAPCESWALVSGIQPRVRELVPWKVQVSKIGIQSKTQALPENCQKGEGCVNSFHGRYKFPK